MSPFLPELLQASALSQPQKKELECVDSQEKSGQEAPIITAPRPSLSPYPVSVIRMQGNELKGGPSGLPTGHQEGKMGRWRDSIPD